MDKMDLHKGGNGGKITARGICHYFGHPSTFHCLVYQIIVLKHPPPPVPIEIVKKTLILDYKFCTRFRRVTGYKSLLLAIHTITYLIVCGCGGVNDDGLNHREPNSTGEGGRGWILVGDRI